MKEKGAGPKFLQQNGNKQCFAVSGASRDTLRVTSSALDSLVKLSVVSLLSCLRINSACYSEKGCRPSVISSHAMPLGRWIRRPSTPQNSACYSGVPQPVLRDSGPLGSAGRPSFSPLLLNRCFKHNSTFARLTKTMILNGSEAV